MRASLHLSSVSKRSPAVQQLVTTIHPHQQRHHPRTRLRELPDVEPTNNAAERGLRASVNYRKLSLGSRSQGGERTIERLLSVDQTCRLQRRSLYAYLADVLTAKARGDPIPTLA
jgi:hypothetical protein